MEGYKAKYPIQALEKSIEILIYIRDNSTSEGLSIAQISKGVGMVKSRVHRVLDTFLEFDFVEKMNDGASYRLGWGAYRLGCSIPAVNNIESKTVTSMLNSLSNYFGEIINLGIKSGSSMIIIKRFFPDESLCSNKLITNVTIGEREPLHCTGIGKLFLSDMSDAEVTAAFEKEDNKQLTEFSITKKSDLLKEIQKVRENGYAIDNMEASTEVFCVAAPIRNFEGRIISGISISVPVGRINADNLEHTAGKMKECALEISRSMGYRS